MRLTVSSLKKLDKKINIPIRKKILKETGQKTKRYGQQYIARNAFATGHLMKSMHYRVMQNQVRIWNDAGNYAWSLDRGMRPHFIHRNMISEAGYTVGDWMDSKGFNPNRKYLLVGAGTPIGRGIQYMQYMADRINKELPKILNKYAKEIK